MRYFLLAGLAAFLGCGDSSGPASPSMGPTFIIDVVGEQFRVQVTDPATIVRLRQRLSAGSTGVVAGKLSAGNGGFNTPWGWHLEPGTVNAPDMATEVCDGRPSDVQNNMTYWMSSVGTYCPWAARVIREEP